MIWEFFGFFFLGDKRTSTSCGNEGVECKAVPFPLELSCPQPFIIQSVAMGKLLRKANNSINGSSGLKFSLQLAVNICKEKLLEKRMKNTAIWIKQVAITSTTTVDLCSFSQPFLYFFCFSILRQFDQQSIMSTTCLLCFFILCLFCVGLIVCSLNHQRSVPWNFNQLSQTV